MLITRISTLINVKKKVYFILVKWHLLQRLYLFSKNGSVCSIKHEICKFNPQTFLLFFFSLIFWSPSSSAEYSFFFLVWERVNKIFRAGWNFDNNLNNLHHLVKNMFHHNNIIKMLRQTDFMNGWEKASYLRWSDSLREISQRLLAQQHISTAEAGQCVIILRWRGFNKALLSGVAIALCSVRRRQGIHHRPVEDLTVEESLTDASDW